MELRISEEYRQSTYAINSLIEDQVLSGSGEGVVSRTSLPPLPIVQGYLMVILSREPTYTSFTKWKLSLNNIILTREFKPHIDTQVSERLAHSIFIYDVTKTLSREVNLKIGYEGKKPLKVDAVLLITVHRYEEFHLGFNFITKVLNLNTVVDIPKIDLSFEPTEKHLNIGITAERNSSLELEILGNVGRSLRREVARGFNMVEVPVERNLDISSINVKCSSGLARHIFTCLFSLYSNYPRIGVKSTAVSDNGIQIALYNSGDSSADDVEVVFLRYGVQVHRIKIGGLKPGEEKDITIPRSITKMNNVIARIVWYKALRVFSRDLNIA